MQLQAQVIHKYLSLLFLTNVLTTLGTVWNPLQVPSLLQICILNAFKCTRVWFDWNCCLLAGPLWAWDSAHLWLDALVGPVQALQHLSQVCGSFRWQCEASLLALFSLIVLLCL